MAKQLPNVVIIGAGFGGMYAARALAAAPVKVTVVDRHNHHLFQPMLYQVAGAALNPSDIASPIRRTLRREPHTEVILADVVRIDTAAKALRLADGSSIEYDYCMLPPAWRPPTTERTRHGRHWPRA